MNLELEVWKQACLQIDLHALLARTSALLAGKMPAQFLLVRRLDIEQAHLETVALIRRDPGPHPTRSRTQLEPELLARVLAWCRAGEVLRFEDSGADPRTAALLPDDLRGPLLAGALSGGEGVYGAFFLLGEAGHPWTPEQEKFFRSLLLPLSAAFEKDRMRHEMGRLREAALAEKRALGPSLDMSESIIGAETGLRGVMERLQLVARTDVPVLILGETGSGKEVVARAIHGRSRRELGPILRVNCGAIPPDLVDSELFGHEKGSFTGAVATRKGWFERADGGTLFLDEIGELPLPAQVRLLRILQDGSFERVGGQQTLNADVRIVAATHRDLHAMVRERRFREDLWYRISVFPIRLPPLRARREDIPALAAHFALRATARLGARPLTPGPEDLAHLAAYDWPGNVRELASVIERAAILGHGLRLEVAAALGPVTRPGSDPAAGMSPASWASPGSPGTPPPEGSTASLVQETAVDGAGRFPSLDAAMARHIESALRRTRGRIEGPEGAAALLGINPHTLRARMRKLGVQWELYRKTSG